MPTRAALRSTCRLLIAALLFAQGAIAMAACEWVSRAPAQALALTQDPSCHDALTANAGLCLAHCLSEDQNRSAPQVLSLALPATYVPAAPAAPAPLLAPVEYAAAPATGPPPRIRFQTLRL